MQERNILIADDVDDAKIARMRTTIECADPYARIHIARSVREAMALIDTVEFDAAAIDFDFLGEPDTGADIIEAVRRENAEAAIALVTARDGPSYEEASAHARSAGADETFTSTTEFENGLRNTLAA